VTETANDTITAQAQVVAATLALEAAATLALESPTAEAVSEPDRAELSDGPLGGAQTAGRGALLGCGT
jgi:hypothetical protein